MNPAAQMLNASENLTAKPKILTIHGVCPSTWQDSAQRVFEPHFRYAAIRYPDYDCKRGGAIKAVVHPIFLIASIGISAWTVYTDGTAWWYAAAAGFLVIGALIAGSQRRRCGDRIKSRISNESSSSYSTHVIAHSFGTYLAAHAMKSYDTFFDRFVLVGCVLRRQFNWNTVFSKRPLTEEHVGMPLLAPDIRNETGTSDLVSWLAGATGWISRELGCAGRKGFVEGPSYSVHTTAGPWHTCTLCQPMLPLRFAEWTATSPSAFNSKPSIRQILTGGRPMMSSERAFKLMPLRKARSFLGGQA